MQEPVILRCASSEAFEAKAENCIVENVMMAIADHDFCTLGLSGGSTPKPIYKKLAENNEIDWAKVNVFLVDERYVPPDHQGSNQRMIRETLLDHVPIQRSNILFPDTTLPLAKCVADYEKKMKSISEPDLVILGMGEDGHIASLFPPLGEEAFGPANVVHTTTDRFAVHDRISVALPFLKAAKQRLLLIAGKAKAELLEQMQKAPENVADYPANALNDERTRWVVMTNDQ